MGKALCRRKKQSQQKHRGMKRLVHADRITDKLVSCRLGWNEQDNIDATDADGHNNNHHV